MHAQWLTQSTIEKKVYSFSDLSDSTLETENIVLTITGTFVNTMYDAPSSFDLSHNSYEPSLTKTCTCHMKKICVGNLSHAHNVKLLGDAIISADDKK